MDFYNKCFYQMICNLDPDGMLNVPVNVFNNIQCLNVYFRTNNDFKKLVIPWMCDQLIIFLNDPDNTLSSTTLFMQNDFQCTKYKFIFTTQALIGLITIHKESIKAFYKYYERLTLVIPKTLKIISEISKKKKRKKSNVVNQSPCEGIEGILQNQNIDTLNQNQLIPINYEKNHELDSVLNRSRHTPCTTGLNIPECIASQTVGSFNPIREFPISNQNMPIEFPSLNDQLDQQPMHTDFLQPINLELQKSILQQTQFTNTNNVNDQQIRAVLNLQENQNQMNDSPENNVINQSLKRKRTSEFIQRKFKKKPIEQSKTVIKNHIKKLEKQEFRERPFQCMIMKSLHSSVNHLPLRHATYRTKLNIPFAARTLDMELEENKNQDDGFNHEITINSYKTMTEKLPNNINNCIYQQYLNNALPRLSMVPFIEENLMDNSSVWRNTMNKMNKKLDNDLKDILKSKTDKNKWEEIKSVVANRASHINLPQPILDITTLGQIDTENIHQISFHSQLLITEAELPECSLPEKSSGNHIQPNINNESYNRDQFFINHQDSPNIPNIDEPVEPTTNYIEKPKDVREMISLILEQSADKISCLMFTDLCPPLITNRKCASLVFVELIKLHQQGILKLSQLHNIIKPSSISIQLNIEYFMKKK